MEPLGAGGEHWDAVHTRRPPDQLTWYQPDPQMSLRFINQAGVARDQPIVDVGAGSSRLCDELLARGFSDITVVDISSVALDRTRERLGESAGRVTMVEADVGTFRSDREYGLWHDRAVFHFLVGSDERIRYIDSMRSNLAPDGHVVMATFGLEGPETCSGLPVRRYDAEGLWNELGDDWLTLVDFADELHQTPRGQTQHFSYTRFRRSD